MSWWQYKITLVDIAKLIDKRNETLWNEIVSKCQFDVQASANAEYACYSKSDAVIFFVPLNNYCPDSFTHELLHVYIRLKEVDDKLYIILNDFITSWIKYDLDSRGIFNSYRDLVDKFYEGLKFWTINKEFIGKYCYLYIIIWSYALN